MDVESSPAKKVPVTILTGHLGAGKTTLLRRMLRNDLGLRIAVIENEFGNEVGIERLLANTSLDGEAGDIGSEVVFKSESDLFVELSNGCVCCSVKDTLVNTLETLLARSRSKFDHIVIETTGLADPGPLAGIFWLDDELESELVLDGVVTVADCANIDSRLADTKSNEARLQLAYADRIILNKRELVTDASSQTTMNNVRAINPTAPIKETSFGRIELRYCLNIAAYDASRLRLKADLDDVDHDPLVKSVVLRRDDRPISARKLRDWVGSLLWEPMKGTEIFRVKGVVWGDDNIKAVKIIQGVHKIFDIQDLPDSVSWKDIDEAKPITKIVVIGRFESKIIKAAFASI
jgi:G3E family GTPase